MESQATLVNPSPPISLVFTKNSVINTTIELNSRLLYSLSTDAATGSKTTITDSTGVVVAVINRPDIFADTVSFPSREGNKAVKISKWLVPQKDPEGFPIFILETAMGQCVLKVDSSSRLALFPPGADSVTPPFAYLQPATSGLPLSLVIEPSTLSNNERGNFSWGDPKTREILEDVIVSVLVLEHRLRMQEKSYHVANGFAQKHRAKLGRA